MEDILLIILSSFSFGMAIYWSIIYIVSLISDIMMKGEKEGDHIYGKIAVIAWSFFYGLSHLSQ